MNNIKITDNGFVWAIVPIEQADNATFLLYPDGSEAQIEEEDYENVKSEDWLGDCELGIELGQLSELRSDWQEATERNNETRSFDAWLEDKAENLIS